MNTKLYYIALGLCDVCKYSVSIVTVLSLLPCSSQNISQCTFNLHLQYIQELNLLMNQCIFIHIKVIKKTFDVFLYVIIRKPFSFPYLIQLMTEGFCIQHPY